MPQPLNIVILGLSITSSWGNGHATIFRALMRHLTLRGHRVLFLERDVPWYAANRDLPQPPFGRTALYSDLDQLHARHAGAVRDADLVVVGSYVPEAVAIGHWVNDIATGITAFYDIDTPVTLAQLARRNCPYLTPELIPRYALYLSFTGGPTLDQLEHEWNARRARPLYCCADPDAYRPRPAPKRWDLAYMGTYSSDRMPALESLLLEPAHHWPQGQFRIVGPQYPSHRNWPGNVEHQDHLPPADHPAFYNAQRFTLNITRRDMVNAGYAPSVRLFEAAACATPIITDPWPGLETFFEPGREIVVAHGPDDVLRWIRDTDESDRLALGQAARRRYLTRHTAAHRCLELEQYVAELAPTPAAP